MALNLFLGWNLEDIEDALRAAQEDLAAGRATVRVASADVGVWSQVENSLISRIEMLLQAANKLDPIKYPIEQVTRSTTYRCVFNSVIPVDPAQDPNLQ
jgi:hypothetical protein